MERLTKNNYADDCFALQNERNQLPEYKDNHYSESQYYVDLWNKVKAIEDIEEELGIDITTLQKDLETLEILKRLLHTCPYTFNNIVDETITFMYGTISGTIYNEEEFKKVQEWLENE